MEYSIVIIFIVFISIITLIILNYNSNKYEHLTDTCSNYSFGSVSCLIACQDRRKKLNHLCFDECVKNRFIY